MAFTSEVKIEFYLYLSVKDASEHLTLSCLYFLLQVLQIDFKSHHVDLFPGHLYPCRLVGVAQSYPLALVVEYS